MEERTAYGNVFFGKELVMNGITELAKLLKDRENPSGYAPLFGVIRSLPEVKIAVGERILLTRNRIVSVVDLSRTDERGRYVYLGRTAVLLPYDNGQKFIVIGVLT